MRDCQDADAAIRRDPIDHGVGKPFTNSLVSFSVRYTEPDRTGRHDIERRRPDAAQSRK